MAYQEAVINNMGEGLYTVNRHGLVVSMNQAAEKLFGWSKEELLDNSGLRGLMRLTSPAVN